MQTASIELGYLAHPDAGPVPGVVMIHDVWGLSDHTRDLARRLAGEGFGVLAVDLYRREPEVKIESPGAFMRQQSDPQVLADVQEAVGHLKQHPATQGRPVGVTGFCGGGMYTLLAACTGTGLSAAVAFYGLLSYEHGLLAPPEGERLDPERKPRSPLDAAADLRCPLLAFFGDQDEFVPLEDVRELEWRLTKTGREAEVVVYPGAGHAFMNDTRPQAYRPETARDAWARTVGFFRRHL